MKTIITTIIPLVAAAGSPALARGCVDGVRVFADVPYDHPFCKEIESLYRDGMTTGCGVDENGDRIFCPGASLTRGMAAMFVEHRDPFAQVSHDGRILIGDHLLNADRVQKGVYHVRFTRDIQRCSSTAWSQDLELPGLEVDVSRLGATIDTVVVRATAFNNDSPVDLKFNVWLHCR